MFREMAARWLMPKPSLWEIFFLRAFPQFSSPGLSGENWKRSDGHGVVPWLEGKSLIWDFTCVGTVCDSYLNMTANCARKQARLRKERKQQNTNFFRNDTSLSLLVLTPSVHGEPPKNFFVKFLNLFELLAVNLVPLTFWDNASVWLCRWETHCLFWVLDNAEIYSFYRHLLLHSVCGICSTVSWLTELKDLAICKERTQ